MDVLQKILKLVEESKKLPEPIIEYSFELPKAEGISAESFYGVRARFNKDVPVATGAVLTYKY